MILFIMIFSAIFISSLFSADKAAHVGYKMSEFHVLYMGFGVDENSLAERALSPTASVLLAVLMEIC